MEMGSMDMGQSVLDLLPQLVLAVGAAVTLLWSLFAARTQQWLTAPLALATLALATVLQVQRAADPRLTFEGLFAVDALSAWATVTIVVTAAVAVLLTPEWLATDRRAGEYQTLLLLSTLGASLLAGAADLMQLIVAVMLTSVTGYVLAAYHRASPLAVEAGIKYFLIGGLTNALLVLGAVLLYGLGGTTLYAELDLTDADPLLLVPAVALLVVGVVFELGAVPAHAWVPDVSEASPLPSAAFLTVVPKLGVLAALARLVAQLPSDLVGWRPLVAVLAAATMTLGNLAALWQQDVRRLLGWSSVSQAGYGLLAVVAVERAPDATPALLFFLVGYSAANVAAFAVVGALRGRTALADYAGLGRARPLLALALTVSMLSLVGIPPLVGFVAKLELFTVAIDAGYAWLAVLAVANTVISLFYYLRVIGPMYLREPGPRPAVLGPWSATATGVAALATAVGGLVAGPLLAWFAPGALLP